MIIKRKNGNELKRNELAPLNTFFLDFKANPKNYKLNGKCKKLNFPSIKFLKFLEIAENFIFLIIRKLL